ncbi:iron chelate uptake ABC transporter family permease subunit [Escherichia coli]|nr:iron chelate uptake ABC transporter family permease subunit [Escherichia coli]
MLVLLLVGACVSVAGPVALSVCWCHIWRASGQASISATRTASEHAAGATLMLLADVLARAGLPGDLPAGAVLALIGSLALSGL